MPLIWAEYFRNFKYLFQIIPQLHRIEWLGQKILNSQELAFHHQIILFIGCYDNDRKFFEEARFSDVLKKAYPIQTGHVDVKQYGVRKVAFHQPGHGFHAIVECDHIVIFGKNTPQEMPNRVVVVNDENLFSQVLHLFIVLDHHCAITAIATGQQLFTASISFRENFD